MNVKGTELMKMKNGESISSIILGTYLITGNKVKTVIDDALSVGYRAFDTAKMYDNEEELGTAFKELLPKHNLKREDIFITTKLDPSNQGNKAKRAIKVQLDNLQCDYIDLYLIHWPGVYGVSPSSKDNLKLRTESWAAMVEAKKEGLINYIGVSNYTVAHLKQLLDNCYGVKPIVNQVEWHPRCHQPELKNFCDKEGIVLQGYMPLGGTGNSKLLDNPTVKTVAEKLGKTSAQVLLRWSLQQNVVVVPKASSKTHLISNLNVNFEIPESDMALIAKLSPEKYDWDPNNIA